jgi:hypothetical protein
MTVTSEADPVLARQIKMIEKIIDDEAWLEGERRGRPVPRTDPVVRERACQIVLRIGQELRERAIRGDGQF